MKKNNFLFNIIFLFTSFLMAQLPPDSYWNPLEPSFLPLPNYLETVYDDEKNIDIIRISDTIAFGYPDGSGELLHGYSKTQSWNSDMTKVFVGFTFVLNASDYSIIKQINFPGGYFTDGRWSNTQPEIRYFCWEESFYKINIETDEVTLLHTFLGYGETTIGPWEGNISADDKYVVITNSNGTKASLFDIQLGIVVSTKEFSSFDWASITPWGDFIVVSNNISESTEVYDLNFNFLHTLYTSQQHADFSLDTQGNEVLVEVIPLIMTRIDNGEVTDLLPEGTFCGWSSANPNIPGHVSGRNFNFPGWALVSTYTNECPNGNGYYYATDMFLVKLDGSGIIKHFGYSRSSFLTYNKNSFASISPDGTKVIFNSDWDFEQQGDGVVFSYVATYNEPLEISDFQKTDFSIYPNPVNNLLTIENNKSKSYSLFNISGKKLKKAILPQGKSFINLTNYPSGIYFIKLETGEIKQLIKK